MRVSVDWTLASELALKGMLVTYKELNEPPLFRSDRLVLAVDHTVDPVTLKDPKHPAQKLNQLSIDFAKKQNLKYFFKANETILHTAPYENLFRPGDIILGADSHTTSHGGLGAFAIGLGASDIMLASVVGESWIVVPEAIQIQYRGSLPFGLTGKDVILRTMSLLKRNSIALNRCVEYTGDLHNFSADFRFTIANMTAEFGGLNGIFEPDEKIASYLSLRNGHYSEFSTSDNYFRADENAHYSAKETIKLDSLKPQIALPFSPDNVYDIDSQSVDNAIPSRKLDGVFIGACTTTEEEVILAALVLQQAKKMGKIPVSAPTGKKVIALGSKQIMERLHAAGLLEIFQWAGFTIDEPGCSFCLGTASRKAGEGEYWLSSQNRNFKNRMGKGSIASLASAITVAVSSLDMKVSDSSQYFQSINPSLLQSYLRKPHIQYQTQPLYEINTKEPKPSSKAMIEKHIELHRTPLQTITSKFHFFGDNIDTDAIIPGEFCHLPTEKELGEKAFYHFRPSFYEETSKHNRTIIVANHGWGTGSSREEAVKALKGAGIKAIIAKSINYIHWRNLINGAVPNIIIEDSKFYEMINNNPDAIISIHFSEGKVSIPSAQYSVTFTPYEGIIRGIYEANGIVRVFLQANTLTFHALTA